MRVSSSNRVLFNFNKHTLPKVRYNIYMYVHTFVFYSGHEILRWQNIEYNAKLNIFTINWKKNIKILYDDMTSAFFLIYVQKIWLKFSRGLFSRNFAYAKFREKKSSRNGEIYAMFREIKSSRNGEITLSFTDLGKSCPSREVLTSKICL